MAPYIAHYVNCKENLAVLYSSYTILKSIMRFQPCEGRKLVLLTGTVTVNGNLAV